MNENKTAIYFVAIVGVVVAVGILTLLLNASNGNVYVSESDLSGEAYKLKSVSGLKGISSTTNIAMAKCCDYTEGGQCIPEGGCH